MADYWEERIAKAQTTLTNKSIAATEKQLKKYYASSMKKTIGQFEQTYNKLISTIAEGKQATPADLYKLDKYWEAQAQLRGELQKLGDKQISLLSKNFETQFFEVYYSFGVPGAKAFNTIDEAAAKQIINQVWCADGKSWSGRVWNNINKLQETLGESLLNTVVTGQKTTELKNKLQKDFGVSYSNADTIVRTEMAHIQTQAAQQRYKDYGIRMVEVWVDEDERTCPICAKREGEKYSVNSPMPIPFHPRCRCCIIPIVEN